MIEYENRGVKYFMKVFKLKGSVFPNAFLIALPCALLTCSLKWLIDKDYLPEWKGQNSIINDNQAFGGFTFLVGFLVVFRTSQAYSRFWDGTTSTHRMRAEWFDACSAIVAFTKYSVAPETDILQFQNTLIRLFSMLHAVALADIEDCNPEGKLESTMAFNFKLIDPASINSESLMKLKECESKVELIYQWIQQLIVENIKNGVLGIPPPILSRSFQEIANGMVAFHEAVKISSIPFPFPYAQTCDLLLMIHWLMMPIVMAQWTAQPVWASVCAFVQVLILWALNFIATEMENPFGDDANDLNLGQMQEEMNEFLLLLLDHDARQTPCVTVGTAITRTWEQEGKAIQESLLDVWARYAPKAEQAREVVVPMSIRTSVLKRVSITHRNSVNTNGVGQDRGSRCSTRQEAPVMVTRSVRPETSLLSAGVVAHRGSYANDPTNSLASLATAQSYVQEMLDLESRPLAMQQVPSMPPKPSLDLTQVSPVRVGRTPNEDICTIQASDFYTTPWNCTCFKAEAGPEFMIAPHRHEAVVRPPSLHEDE